MKVRCLRAAPPRAGRDPIADGAGRFDEMPAAELDGLLERVKPV